MYTCTFVCNFNLVSLSFSYKGQFQCIHVFKNTDSLEHTHTHTHTHTLVHSNSNENLISLLRNKKKGCEDGVVSTLQICYIMTAVTVCIRMDIFGVLYAVLLALVMLFSHRMSARIWWLYLLLLAILLPIQFLVSLGFPPLACVGQWNGSPPLNGRSPPSCV